MGPVEPTERKPLLPAGGSSLPYASSARNGLPTQNDSGSPFAHAIPDTYPIRPPSVTFDDVYREFVRAWRGRQPASASHTTPRMDVPILVACSAGGDSVALVRLMHRWWQESDTPAELAVAHFNHGLRGDDSNDDERFVRKLCHRLCLPCHVDASKKPAAANPSAPCESELRDQRRDFFLRTASQHGYRYVVSAHTQDDQIETVLFRLFRGSGISGLSGIPANSSLGTDVVLKRPLLAFTRQQLRDFLSDIEQDWREDHTNNETDYTRNYLRHELWPRIEDRFPQAGNAIVRFASLAEEQTCALRSLALQWLDRSAQFEKQAIRFELAKNAPTPQAVIVLACQIAFDRMQWSRGKMSFEQWQQLARVINANASHEAFQLPGNLTVVVQDSAVVVSKPTPNA